MNRWRASRRRIGAFSVIAVSLYAALLTTVEYGPARLHDPEYGRRLQLLKARIAENPERPLIVALGSSRMAMDLHPATLDPTGPLLFNFALVGSGPIMQRMVWQRLRADGIQPDAVIIEYWPAFLHEVGEFHEAARFDRHRLRTCDRGMVEAYFPDPQLTLSQMRHDRWNPIPVQRRNWQNQIWPKGLPAHKRIETLWDRIDSHGHLPGMEAVAEADYDSLHEHHGSYYRKLFAEYEISAVGDAALHGLLADCVRAGVPTMLVYLPESPAFREWIPPEAQLKAHAHKRDFRSLGVPFVDAQDWVQEEQIPDRIHLLAPGAKEFSARFAHELPRIFPTLYRRGGP